MDDTPTYDEVMRVRRYECSMIGHSWTPMMRLDSQDPVSIICDNCGRKLLVMPGEAT